MIFKFLPDLSSVWYLSLFRRLPEYYMEIDKQGVAAMFAEQNAELALELARHGYVLETGNIALEGEASGLMDNEHVRKAYLGIWGGFRIVFRHYTGHLLSNCEKQ